MKASFSSQRPVKANASAWTIRQQCTADWEKMRGDDKRRFCEHCQRFVHNVSAMSRAEREVLARPENMRECVFYAQRPDGEMADLSVIARLRRVFPFLRVACWSALIALLPVTLSGCMGVRCPRPGDVRPIEPETTPTPSQASNSTGPVESAK